MELKATSLLLLMCVAVIILSAEVGTIPQCCLVVSKKIPRDMLRAVRRFEVQSSSGHCDIDALILHIRSRKICAHPKMKKLLEKLMKKPRKDRKPKPA